MGKAAKLDRFEPGDKLKITEESSPLYGFLLTYESGHGKMHGILQSGNRITVPLEHVEKVDE